MTDINQSFWISQEPQLQNLLSIKECVQNPSLSFLKGILEPLRTLKNVGKIFSESCIILVDSLNEAEFHKPDYGDTIASFLCRHANKFPGWLKLVVSVQSDLQDITVPLPFHRISLNPQTNHPSDQVANDIMSYVDYRISHSPSIQKNLAVNGRFDKDLQAKFTTHVQSLSRGCFLYTRLVLDLIERGQLVPKSSNYKILPVNLSEVFLLLFNLKFSSVRGFERVSTILGVCLAALYPLTSQDIFMTINSGFTQRFITWDDFCQRMGVLSGFLFRRRDNTFMFFHPAFRDWLIRRDETDSPKFLCDLRWVKASGIPLSGLVTTTVWYILVCFCFQVPWARIYICTFSNFLFRLYLSKFCFYLVGQVCNASHFVLIFIHDF